MSGVEEEEGIPKVEHESNLQNGEAQIHVSGEVEDTSASPDPSQSHSTEHHRSEDEDQPPPPPAKDGLTSSPVNETAISEVGEIATNDYPTSTAASTNDTKESSPSPKAQQHSPPLSSIIFVVSALEQIAGSKEARKVKALGETANRALEIIKEQQTAPDPEILFEPLHLATETTSIPLTTNALDCIGKLISYSYFSVPAPPQDPSVPPSVPLIERAIDTICDCFQDDATPQEIQLQIVKSLLAAVLNDKIIVHGSGLLKSVRQIYNIFLISKSAPNQQLAQGTLSQMVGTVFERVSRRSSAREARLNLSKATSEKDTANNSQLDLSYDAGLEDSSERNVPVGETDTIASETQNRPVKKEVAEKMTLQSFMDSKSFDDAKIGDNAPTMVTQAKPTRQTPRTASGQTVSLPNGSATTQGYSNEDDEDEIYVKDAFLVFRSMCRLSTKVLSPDQQQDVKSSNMRSKMVSLALIRTLLNNYTTVFTSPTVTIRNSTNDEPTSFGQAITQYLRLSLGKNGASSVRQVFECCCEIFWLMLKHMRTMMKREIEVFLKEIYLAILDRRNAPAFQKLYVMKIMRRLAVDPRALVEIYLNYDCESDALDNMFQRMMEHLSRLSGSPIAISAQQQLQYQEQSGKDLDADFDWQDTGKLPPSLTTTSLAATTHHDSEIPVEYLLKRHSLDALVRTLRSLVNWSQDNIAITAARLDTLEMPQSVEKLRESLDPGKGPGSPSISTADTPLGPSTPLLEDDPGQLEKAKLRKTALDNGIRQFNFKPKRGIKSLVENGFITSNSPEDIASFILEHDSLDKSMIGEYLGEGDPENVAIMHAFVDSMDFNRRRFVDALRTFLQSFRLPGEAQKIDRFMLKFAERYIAGNPNAFANADTAYVLAYSVIMLNTDQHSTKLKGKRMTPEDFIKNNRGINDNANLPDEYLTGIFDEIAHSEIVLDTERQHAAAMGTLPQPAATGLAGRANQVFLTVTRDLQREAFAQASEEMSNKAEQRLRSMIKAQRKAASKQPLLKYIPATSFKHVGPMFDVTWMSFLSGLSGQMQDTQNLETIKTCMEGLKLAIQISCLFDLETPRVAFVTALAKFTNLGNLREMMAKNLEALKVLVEVAQTEGNMLKNSWRDVLTCISQLDRFQLISGGVDESVVPDVSKARIVPSNRTSTNSSKRSLHPPSRSRPALGPLNSSYQNEIAEESRSSDMIRAVDRVFTTTANLNGDAIVHFVRALCEVSWQEIQSSGQSDSPRTYSLQKLVEVSRYNMTRVRFEWSIIWQVLGEHFNEVGCHTNTNVVFFALDSLRRLSMDFLDLEELPGFKFQKDFLKPFEHVMANSTTVTVKDMVLRCLIQMIQAKGDKIRSGWKTMFGVFTVAAREQYETIVNLAFDHVNQIYNARLGVVISQGAFADLIVCLTEFSKNLRFQKKSLAAIEMLKSSVPKMLKTPECPLSHRTNNNVNGVDQNGVATSAKVSRQTQEEQYWFPVLFAFHDVLMTGEDLEVRSHALNYLFDTLIRYGGDFPHDFWDILWRQLLYPIFMVLKSKSEMSKVANREDLSVWLSTTMIQALRNIITLFTHYFESLEYMLDRFLDLLALCICQENDTIARIGSNCLQQLILQNVAKFEPEHWSKVVGSFVELFERTTAYQLFSAVTSSSDSSYIAENENVRKGSIEPVNANELSLTGPSTDSSLPSSPTSDTNPKAPEKPGKHSKASSTVTNGETEGATPGLEDYRPQADVQQPVVVTAARRRFFNKIITRCVLQLLMIETVNELFSNDAVYTEIPSSELLRLMMLLKSSYLFAKKFNNNKDLRMRLWREGFMKQPPNLLKQESGSAATYINILFRMYHDEGDERRKSRPDTEAALIPLCADIIRGFVALDETQPRNIDAWRPVVLDVMEGYSNFPREDFDKHIDLFYSLGVEIMNRELGHEMRIALQNLFRRIGEVRMGMTPVATPLQTPTSPRSVASTYFSRRSSRGR